MTHNSYQPGNASDALAQIDALISNGARPTVNERNAFEHYTALNQILMQIRDIAREPRPQCGVQTEALALQAVREDERLACWKIADKERTALKNADPDKAAWLVAFDIANAIKMRGTSPLPSAYREYCEHGERAYCATCSVTSTERE